MASSFCRGVIELRVDHRRDVVQVPMLVLRLVLDGDLRGAKALLLHRRGHQPHAGQPQRVDARVERARSTPASTSAPKRHVAADAAGTIEIGDLHRRGSPRGIGDCKASERKRRRMQQASRMRQPAQS